MASWKAKTSSAALSSCFVRQVEGHEVRDSAVDESQHLAPLVVVAPHARRPREAHRLQVPQQRVDEERTRVAGPTHGHPYLDQAARLSATSQRLLRHLAHTAILPQARPVGDRQSARASATSEPAGCVDDLAGKPAALGARE